MGKEEMLGGGGWGGTTKFMYRCGRQILFSEYVIFSEYTILSFRTN